VAWKEAATPSVWQRTKREGARLQGHPDFANVKSPESFGFLKRKPPAP
jgi:hypothetical protein